MPTLTEEQAERVRDLLESYQDRVEKKEELYAQGEIGGNIPSFFSRLASKHKYLAITQLHVGQLESSRENFQMAAERYLTSAQEYDSELAVLATRPLTDAVYTAALAGDKELLNQTISAIQNTFDNLRLEPDAQDADRFFLAGCLAETVMNNLSPETIENLEAVNQTKNDVNALYGQSILEFARGTDSNDVELVEQAIDTMLEYHDRDRHEDNVIDLIMAPEATALVILARWDGFDIESESEFIPSDLVEAVS